MLVIGQRNRIGDTSCLCKWTVRVLYARRRVNVVFFMKTCNRCLVSFLNFVIVMINWYQEFASSSSVCNHTNDKQIELPLRDHPILSIASMITDRIGLHAFLLLLAM